MLIEDKPFFFSFFFSIIFSIFVSDSLKFSKVDYINFLILNLSPILLVPDFSNIFLISLFDIKLIEIKLHNFFLFAFHGAILISWLDMRFDKFAHVCFAPLFFSFFYLFYSSIFNFYYIILHWVGWELSFIIFFCLFFVIIFQSYDLNYMFEKLIRVDLKKKIILSIHYSMS
jgi:hypothetical protein